MLRSFRVCEKVNLYKRISLEFRRFQCGGRKYCVGGNMKMNGCISLVEQIAKTLKEGCLDANAEVFIAPPYVYIDHARKCMPRTVGVAAQNCHKEEKGAFTGELAPAMLREVGADYVILGHSERRTIFCESDELIGQKVELALLEKLKVVACVGESLQQYEAKQTKDVVLRQLCAIASKVSCWDDVIIAYEPVWAIGTGKSASPKEVQEVHTFMRKWICENICKDVSEKLRIQYGGSVTAKNVKELACQPDIDGFLVGGAALKPEFVDIINAKKK